MNNDNVLQNILDSPFPIVIKSSAGSGKTHSLIEKIKHMVEVNNINPANIMCCTFTQDAAMELKQRLPYSCSNVTAGTMHSILFDVVKKHHGKSWYVADNVVQQQIAFSICKEHKMNFDKIYKWLNDICYLKATNVDYYKKLVDGDLPLDNKANAFANEYWNECKKRHKLDFGDMLLYAYEVFIDKPKVLEMYQEQWKYILADECQDLSNIQAKIIELLSEKYCNLLVVGDLKQSIYSFNGSQMQFFERIQDKFHDANMFELPKTYRCARKITCAGNKIARMIDGSKIETVVDADGEIIIPEIFQTNIQEVDYISALAIKLYKTTNKSIRIIFRTNAQSLGFQIKMIDADIPFSSNFQNNIFNRKEIKIGLALYSFVSEFSEMTIYDKIEVLKLLKYLVDEDSAVGWHNFMWEIKKIKKCPMQNPYLYDKYLDKITVLKILETNNLGNSLSELLGIIVDKKLLDEVSDNARDNLLGVADFVSNCKNMSEVKELIEKISRPKTAVKTERVISLSTIHGSKGLESDVVFVTGIADGLFPLKSGEPEEELRLFYVAVTRAKETLYLTGSNSFGKRLFDSHSYIDFLR